MNLLYTAHVPAGDGPFPAILLLHGWGASAHDLLGLAPLLFDGQALVLCPQGTVAVPFGGGQYGYGWFPPQLAEELPRLPEQEGFPVLILHGTRDDRIEVERARESREALRPYGVAMTYREFDMGHEIRPDALKVVLQWLKDKTAKKD